MKSESVTKAWEFYRDNCQGFKEPMRKEFRRLDEYVASLESDNAKLRERIHELEMEGSDHFYRTAYAEDANRTLEADNAKLRELVDYMTPIAWYGASERERDRMRELGVEV